MICIVFVDDMLTHQVLKVEVLRKPALPPSADPITLSQILGASSGVGRDGASWGLGWRMVRMVEGVRLMQQVNAAGEGSCRCRRAQVRIYLVKILSNGISLIRMECA